MRRGGERSGQATSEYVALVALVAVVLALAAGLTSGGVGGTVLAGLRRGICEVAGAACPRPEPPRDELEPCPLDRGADEQSLEGAYEVAALGRQGTLIAERRSDGRVTVTLAHGTNAGVAVGLGFQVGAGRRRGLGATASVEAKIASGRSWTLPDAAAARAFVDRYGSQATIGGQAVDLVRSGCSILCDAIGWRPHAELPPPDEQYLDHGAMLLLGAPRELAHVSADALLGARLRRDGTSTWYLQARVDAGGAAAGLLGTTGAAAQRQVVVAYTLDGRGQPLELSVQSAVQGGAVGKVAGARGRWTAGAGAGAALVTEHDATLDLRDPRNAAAARGLIATLRDPGAYGGLRRAVAGVQQRIARTGVVDRRTYALTSSDFELGAQVALGGQLGATFRRSHERMRLLSAETRLPGLPFLPRDDCREG
jgi:hypothetical protein